ncbi:TonB-dependent receptor [Mucilaginibacter pedocola]|uniref:TonB-dependent receptor plug domain-containing protein n=1 Tax=Mucilaginibacter pedocola TaxID=1792845 RepID=A0A1S9P9D1_9SPHI|nr:TonB-dependent receptor [Mucilaginibacter pedocola]OOQ57565.1 hypothetical protein BC343_12215 [Mucilaginibacter pedocola]
MNKHLQIFIKCFTFLIAGIILMPSAGFAQNGKGALSGTVMSDFGLPVDMASVQLRGTGQGAKVNEKGSFLIENIRPGKYRLQVSKVGYNKVDTAVVIDADVTAQINIVLTASSAGLSEVTITSKRATAVKAVSPSLRLNTPLIETPQNITVTSQQTIKSIGALSLSEILRTSSGIIAGGAKQDISFNVRGTQVYSSILRNGVGSGYWFNQEADAAMIERVEFVKGPAGFMISNTEPGGLVNIVTKQPTHDRIASFGFGTGSFNMMRTNVDLGGEVTANGALTYRLNAGLQQQNDFYQFGKFNKNFVALALKYE